MSPYIVSITYDLSMNGIITPQRREITISTGDPLTAIQDAVSRLRDELYMSHPDGHLVDVTVRCIITD